MRYFVLILVGAQLGQIAASLIAPSLLTWYATPGAGSALCECAPLVTDTVGRVVQTQLVGAVIGAIAMLSAGIAFTRLRRSSPKAAPTA